MGSKGAGAYVALMRGINVGGKNMLPMKDLVVLFEKAGCTDVRHYIQSGNVIFRAPAALGRKIPEVIQKDIERGFGLKVPIVLRTAEEWATVARSNPFLTAGANAENLHVMFLADEPGAAGAALDPNRSPPDTFVLQGREIYLSLPNGAARTKLTNAWFDSKLKTTSTSRNWRTVLTLLEMTGG